MRTLWNVIAILSFAHLMAVGGFVGWLLNSGRLDAERAETIRTIFSETVAEQRTRETAEAEAEAEAEREAVERAKLEAPSVSSNEAAMIRLSASEIDRQRIERLRREIEDLRRSLVEQRQVLDADRAQLDADREAFEAVQEQIRDERGDAQFEKSLKTLEGLRPAEGAQVVLQLIADEERNQAVAYLDAMKPDVRIKLIAELVEQDPGLAKGLLEDIRLRGMEPGR